MKTVFLNLRFLTQPLSGMQRYAEELVGAMAFLLQDDPGLLPDTRLVGLVPAGPRREADWPGVEIRACGPFGGHLWEQTTLYRHARGGVLVSLTGTGPLLHGRQMLALHDANVFANPHFFPWRYRTLHRALRPLLARRAAALLTISEFSRNELARYCGVDPARFAIIPDSAEHMHRVNADPAILTRAGLEPGAYALCVGNQSPNKNIRLAVEAFKQLECAGLKLAVAGGTTSALKTADLGPAPWLVHLGRVSDGELRALYENAAMLVFPSIYEGFGVPPLEALTLGCPVAASNSSALPEVLGEHAAFFDPAHMSDCAAAMSSILGMSKSEQQRSISAGRAHSQKFNWQTSAMTVLEKLREIQR